MGLGRRRGGLRIRMRLCEGGFNVAGIGGVESL
jgi:hypothetical protein